MPKWFFALMLLLVALLGAGAAKLAERKGHSAQTDGDPDGGYRQSNPPNKRDQRLVHGVFKTHLANQVLGSMKHSELYSGGKSIPHVTSMWFHVPHANTESHGYVVCSQSALQTKRNPRKVEETAQKVTGNPRKP